MANPTKPALCVDRERHTMSGGAQALDKPSTPDNLRLQYETRTVNSSPGAAAANSASPTTSTAASNSRANATEHTSVPSADTTSATHNGAPSPPLRPHPQALRLDPEGWRLSLNESNLDTRYPSLVSGLQNGLTIGIKKIAKTHVATHYNSAKDSPSTVEQIIAKELEAHRYAGPFTASEVEAHIGPFQTAPLGLRPKPNGKFRLIQDFSFPKYKTTKHKNVSINSMLDITEWPTTWYTFLNICQTIISLPHDAEAFVRDVTAAFRNIPLHPSQWPGTVVEWEGNYYIDRFLAFGLGPACGAFGMFADAFADICRAKGLGPTGHWVDDNVFFRLPISALAELNHTRANVRAQIHERPVRQRGRLFWSDEAGGMHAEDYSHPIRVLPGAENGFSCGLSDIDAISNALGWPWEKDKDAPWASTFTYGGLTFSIATREVSLPEKKRLKYLDTIRAWKTCTRHQLHHAQRLLGQLQHATTVHRFGRFHLKGLIDFIRAASREKSRRYQLRRDGRQIPKDISWWESHLSLDTYWRCFDPEPAFEIDCFCDGSTSYGAGVHIAGRERAFPLHPHHRGKTDIKTVESLSLELAVEYAAVLGYNKRGIIIHSDSTPVCGAFKKGRMAADEANQVLSRVAGLEQQHHIRGAGSSGGDDPGPSRPHTPERAHAVARPKADPARPWKNLVLNWKNNKVLHPSASIRPVKAEITQKGKSKAIKTSFSPNRPQTKLVAQRFASWKPCTPTKVKNATKESALVVRNVALAAYMPGTQKNYSTALTQWHKYCDDHKIPEKKREPADPHLVEHWVASRAGTLSGGYLKDWISALKAYHSVNNLPWLPNDERLSLLRRGVSNLQPDPRPPRDPMTVEWLEKVIQVVDKTNPKEVATAAAAAVGFWGLMRLGEMVSSKTSVKTNSGITRARTSPSLAFGGLETYTLRLPRTKTQPTGDTVVIVTQKRCNPIELLRLHLESSPSLPDTDTVTPLFAYRAKNKMEAMTRPRFLSTIETMAARAGVSRLHGHSMRIGGCTTLLTNGVPPDRVRLHGRWSTDAFKLYIRNHAAVMAPYLAINQVASDRLHHFLPTIWPSPTITTQQGPAPPATTSQPSHARGRNPSRRARSKRGR
ncbi:hypothetical protein CF319_g8559 [Tilletia indica]|nr:hypothetical protein CF319_g8559 [Tilletia indica]